jgi:hypothetical protein
VHAIQNFKNVSLSLSRKHQLHHAYILNGCLHNSVEFGSAKKGDNINFPFSNLLKDFDTFYTVRWVCIDGIKYKAKKCFILSDFTKAHSFVQVHTILSVNTNPIFVCLKTKYVEKDAHMCAYLTELANDYIVIDPLKFEFKMIFHMHLVGSKTYILIKQSFNYPY